MDVQERVEQDADFLQTLLDWLAANGIDHKDIPHGTRPSLVDGQLTFPAYLRDPQGRVQEDPAYRADLLADGTTERRPLTHTVTVPVTVEPNADVLQWLIPPCSSCGR